MENKRLKHQKSLPSLTTKHSGTFEGKSNALGHGGRAAQLKARGVPGGVIGNLARAAHAAPGQANYHGKHMKGISGAPASAVNRLNAEQAGYAVAGGLSPNSPKLSAMRGPARFTQTTGLNNTASTSPTARPNSNPGRGTTAIENATNQLSRKRLSKHAKKA